MVTIEGVVEEIIFNNEVNGYTVCEIKYDKETATAVGYMPFLNLGESVKLSGNWVNHPDYGEQLKVESYEKLLPKTLDAIEKYLSSGVLKGIGPATATKIVKRFGEDSLNVIQFNPHKLSEIRGISFEKAIKIGQAFNEQQGLRNVILFFQEYGINPSYSTRIYKLYGDRAIEEIKNNPYKLSDEIHGITFKTSDQVAMSLGIDPSSDYRLASGIKYVLTQASAGGHTYLPEDKLVVQASQLLNIQIDNIQNVLIKLLIDRAICMEKSGDYNKIYLSSFYNAELSVCRKLIELASAEFSDNSESFSERLDEIQQEEGIILAANQVEAVREACQSGVSIITGGPGTGKTTIIKSIIKLLKKDGFEVVLAAPTGRAAKRMAETTGFDAKTIHRLLEIGYSGNNDELVFTKNDINPIEANAIIIDEVSMVDILLMNNLLKAVMHGTRLILVGDVDQLPSVGAGCVLKDIIACGMMRTVKLTEVFRQAQESMIVVNAHRINKGDMPFLNIKEKDFFFMLRQKGDDIINTIVELCETRLTRTYGYDPMKHIQILTPTKKGVTGILSLNTELQKVLNPADKNKNEKVYRDFVFREGDKVMQVKNNYSIRWEKQGLTKVEGFGVFNGDTGVISEINNEDQFLSVLFDDEKIVEYDYSILDEIEPAFAVTIHKSQGSEFPCVIIPIFQGPQILMTRNLLYTAITRAKDLVILVGSDRVLYQMVNNERETQRFSGLMDKLIRGFLGLSPVYNG